MGDRCETYVTEVAWKDSRPRFAPVGLAPRAEAVEERFDFSDGTAHGDPGWLAVRRMPGDVASAGEWPGWLTIRAAGGALTTVRPDFVGRRQRHITSRFQVRVARP
ncbi:hypothetical protein LO772_30145 [Yinghuangia sp. ASG 101]|uniref:hypothetical protein n=1 Tax=Yinghuangia sp. ASG 101 TaxID=2896848 RepID=UPI001E2C9E63|nr:hypothetical protein [Yinghuangia sp. ASG 101]UGQ11026.1 hypothetical protein LO772_30145 [Yinghuangia sp. ASG 101]